MSFLKSESPSLTNDQLADAPEVLRAYAEYERQITVRHLKVGCWLVMVLMPVGLTLDFFVYPKLVGFFLELRVICSVLALLAWGLLQTRAGQEHPLWLGLVVAMLPVFFISWMIWASGNPASPYYAGLNLILISVAFVLRWDVLLSVTAVLLTIAMYLGACLGAAGSSIDYRSLYNNLYFLVLTGVIVVTGSRIHRRLRIREFNLRYELEQTIHQLKETELQLVHSEKLASLGRMSAGLIHEINNPLNYAKTGLYSLRNTVQHLPPEQKPRFAEILKDVEDGVNRVKEIVTDLRPFTHSSGHSFDRIEVARCVASALRFLSHQWKDQVTIHQEIPPGLLIRANPTQLTQVLVNLLQNALEALQRQTDRTGPPNIRMAAREAGPNTLLTIQDNGPGIVPENQSKVFEPFFTTKPVGEGMGLGLSICYRILQEHGGTIRVRSEPGQGCEFTLEFPLHEPTVPHTTA